MRTLRIGAVLACLLVMAISGCANLQVRVQVPRPAPPDRRYPVNGLQQP